MSRAFIVLFVAACSDFATPAELDHPQVLAVRADPPALSGPGSVALDVVVAGDDGLIVPERIAYFPALGTMTDNGLYVPPDPVPTTPTDVHIDVEVNIPGRAEPLLAEKWIELGAETTRENPRIHALYVGDNEATGALIELDLVTDVEVATDVDNQIAWYSTVGVIENYRDNPAVFLVEPEEIEGATGTLIAVVRDERNGVSWHTQPVAWAP